MQGRNPVVSAASKLSLGLFTVGIPWQKLELIAQASDGRCRVALAEEQILNPVIADGRILHMSKLETIEAEVRKLPLAQAVELQDWLAGYLEDSAELNPEFIASIERGNADLREGRVRVHRPDNEKG